MKQSIFFVAAVTFVALCPRSGLAAPPGCYGSEYRAFDFMIGTFTARSRGKVNGKAEVRRELAGCTIRMHWTGRTYEGTNNNTYDATRMVWQKAWFDNTGGVELSEGRIVHGALVYKGNDYDGGKLVAMHRESWIPLRDGRILERYEASDDRGRTWKPVFDTYYTHVSRAVYLAQRVAQDR